MRFFVCYNAVSGAPQSERKSRGWRWASCPNLIRRVFPRNRERAAAVAADGSSIYTPMGAID